MDLLGKLRSWRGRVGDFFGATVWEADLDQLPRKQALLYRSSRILYSTVTGFREHRLTFRAAALTYYTILSIVPFLAFAFSVLKGFGAYDRFIDQTLRPYLQSTFGANPALLDAIGKVLDFVEHADVGRLGTAGILILAYGGISLLSNVEEALNGIWGARSKRPLVRQVTDYTTLMVVTPILMLVAATFATAAQSSGIIGYLRRSWAVGTVIDFVLSLTSMLVAVLGMIAIYVILPNAKTRVTSSVLGGVVAGLLWQLALVVHVNSQAGVARYNALYAGFLALPIFLVWTYISWAIVLVGGLLAASHQNELRARQRVRARGADQAFRETLGLALAGLVVRGFVERTRPLAAIDLARALQVPGVLAEEVLDALTGGGILVKTLHAGMVGYRPGCPIDETRVADVLAALRCDPAADDLRRDFEGHVGPELTELVRTLEVGTRSAEGNLTLRELARLAPHPPGEPTRSKTDAQAAAASAEVLDGKQPETSL